MAISLDWGTQVIFVPKADTLLVTLLPQEVRQLDINAFRLALKDLEDSEEGMPFLDTHRHNPPVTVGGVTLARVIEIINGYTITFEDGQYAVNLVGANSNISDVTNVNQVSVRSANSAGLTFSEEINKQSFMGGIIYVSEAGRPGTSFPRGTPYDPVDNLIDAKVIGDVHGFRSFMICGSFTLTEDFQRYSFESNSSITGSIDLGGRAVDNCVFKSLTITGNGSGNRDFQGCVIPNGMNGLGVQTAMENCNLGGTFIVSPGYTFEGDRCTSQSGVAFDLNGTGSLALANFSGIVTVGNAADPGCSIAVTGTYVCTLLATCTAGQAYIGGIGIFNDLTSGGVTITERTLPGSVWDEVMAVHQDPGTVGANQQHGVVSL